MIELLKYINSSCSCHKEESLQTIDIIKTQKELVKKGCPFLPKEYIEFLKNYNGISAADCGILGIPPLDDNRLNIIEYNANNNASTDVAILGYDDSTYLIYDNKENTYKLIDRVSTVVLETFLSNELAFALNSILHL